MTSYRLFFCTDLHGSDRCFRKFINAAAFYGAKALILGGDIAGKAIVPVVKGLRGQRTATYLGKTHEFKTRVELDAFAKEISDSGYYVYETEEQELQHLNESQEELERLFIELILERIKAWLDLADDRLNGTGTKCYISPGNDDALEIDDVLKRSAAESDSLVYPEDRVVTLDSGHEMIALGWANHTPWNSPRETTEEDLQKRIEAMAHDLRDPRRSIFNLHVPPLNTHLDQAPLLDESLKPVSKGGAFQLTSVGSSAVRSSIETFEPLLGLHGHIHESRGVERIGKTTCLNPGSEYSQGVLLGAVVDLSPEKIRSYRLANG